MLTAGTSRQPINPSEIKEMMRQMQDETILHVLPGLCIAGFILVAASCHSRDPLQMSLPALILLLLPPTVWALHRSNSLLSAWVLVSGSLLAVMLLVTWGRVDVAIALLALPVGFAALFVSLSGGALTAAICTFLVLYAPSKHLALDPALQSVALTNAWGALGLVWLTQRPLVTTMQWSWSSWERSRDLLEQARDYQAQLRQAMEDLADANLQLTRLNRLAQGLHQAAENARRAKEEFVANVSHELRTPLNMIIGYSEFIARAPHVYGGSIPPALLADLAVIRRNSQHLSDLVDDVLDLSQIEAGRMALMRERESLPEILAAATTAVRPLFESKGLYLRTDIAQDLPLVFCDRTRIREVVLNLLSNAGRFTERGGVYLRAWQDGDDVVVSVADTGPGIPAEQQERVFQPFQQADGSTRRVSGGSGLGLSISKAFVELHGGRMWLESQVGTGTVFSFRLPVEPPAPADRKAYRWLNPYWDYQAHPRRSTIPRSVVRPRFVILESGNVLQRLLSRYMDNAEIVPVSSVENALRELADVPAQALLVNDISVSEALQRLNQSATLPCGTPAIVCSLVGMPEGARAIGIADYLVKPVSQDELLAALDRLPLRGKSILMVDDEPEALRLFQRMLAMSGRGYRVFRATNARQALSILHQRRPDAILLDLVMPEMDGFQLLEARATDPALRDIPVVVISARDPAGQPIVSRALGVTCSGGLSVPSLLACIEAISGILGTAGQAPDPVPTETPTGSPAYG